MAEGENVAGEKKMGDLKMLPTIGSDVKYTSRCDAKCVVGIRVKGGDFWRCDMGCVAGNRVVGGDETGTSAWMT